jgi:hypothetical protein
MRAAPKRTRVQNGLQTSCRRAAAARVSSNPSTVQHAPHSLKLLALAHDMHRQLLFLQISLALSRKPATVSLLPCTPGRDSSMVYTVFRRDPLMLQPALLQFGLNGSQSQEHSDRHGSESDVLHMRMRNSMFHTRRSRWVQYAGCPVCIGYAAAGDQSRRKGASAFPCMASSNLPKSLRRYEGALPDL